MEGAPETRYADSGGLSIAYQVVGSGPLDLVLVPGFMSHVELNWEYPFYGDVLARIAEFARVVVLDKRGTGLSDRSLGLGTLEERMDDVRAVMDAAGVERAALAGISEGAALSVMMAATHPDRVSELVLLAGFCPGAPPQLSEPQAEAFCTFIREHWTTGRVINGYVQHAPDPEACLPGLARFERYCCTAPVAEEIMRRNLASDVRGVLESVTVPTLVCHQLGDPVCPAGHARYYAEHIPNARLAMFDGDFHGSWRPCDNDEALVVIREFLTGEADAAGPAAPGRILATVLFTDIVDSTATAADMGDARWRELLDDHDAAARAEVEAHGGILVKSTGDGILARFDGPSRAVGCAHRLEARVGRLGLRTRAGAHTGEVELRGDDVGGLAVHIASRVASLAGAGEVLVSRTVKDLTAGSGLTFEDRGEHALKGVPEPWRVYATAVTADGGAVYEEVRQRFVALVLSLGPDDLERVVPATPAWRVRDALAHVVGISHDLNRGELGEGHPDDWTANHVDSRRERTIEEIVAEWDLEAPTFEEGLRIFGYGIGSHFVGDLHAHLQDVHLALGLPPVDDPEVVGMALDFYVASLDEALLADGAGSLTVVADGVAHPCGAGGPSATVRGPAFEVLRALSGRRSLAQIRALDWQGDVDALAPLLSRYPLPEADLVD